MEFKIFFWIISSVLLSLTAFTPLETGSIMAKVWGSQKGSKGNHRVQDWNSVFNRQMFSPILRSHISLKRTSHGVKLSKNPANVPTPNPYLSQSAIKLVHPSAISHQNGGPGIPRVLGINYKNKQEFLDKVFLLLKPLEKPKDKQPE